MKDVRKARYSYNEFVERKSLLDQIYIDSSISKSPFKGIMRCSMIFAFLFVINNLLVSYYNLTCRWGCTWSTRASRSRTGSCRSRANSTTVCSSGCSCISGHTCKCYPCYNTVDRSSIRNSYSKGSQSNSLLLWSTLSNYFCSWLCLSISIIAGREFLIWSRILSYIWASTRMYMYFQVCIHYFKVSKISLSKQYKIDYSIDELLLQEKQRLPNSILSWERDSHGWVLSEIP